MTQTCQCDYQTFFNTMPLEHNGVFHCGTCGYPTSGTRAEKAKACWANVGSMNDRIIAWAVERTVPPRRKRRIRRSRK